MTRDITTALRDQVTASALQPIALFEAIFDSGALRFWTGYGEITWNGVVWSGAGNLIGVSDVTESQELRAVGTAVTLSGIPSELISIALAEDYQGRPCAIYLGALDGSTLVADPYKIFGGIMDVMEIDDAGEFASITLAAESRLIDLERPRERRYEHEDQQALFAGDRGLEYVPTIQDAPIIWGRS